MLETPPEAITGILVFFGTRSFISFFGALIALTAFGYLLFFSNHGRQILRKILGKRASIFADFGKTLRGFSKLAIIQNLLVTVIRIVIVD